MNFKSDLENFTYPSENQWTIYTKSNCKYCTMVKELLNDNLLCPIMINCDEWIGDNTNKKIFLNKIKNIIGQEYKTFPMVFKNKTFIGGFTDTYKFITLHKIIDPNIDLTNNTNSCDNMNFTDNSNLIIKDDF
jgi:glutaredoxin